MRFIRAELRRVVRQKEIWIVTVVCAAIALLGLAEPLLSAGGDLRFYTLETVPSAERHMMLYGTGVGNVTTACIVPVLAALPYALSYAYDRRNHLDCILLCRCGASAYFFGRALIVALIGFSVACLPFLLNLVYCLVAYPLKHFESASIGVVYGQLGYAWETGNALFKTLYFNDPVLDTLAHIALTGLFGMTMALCTYSVSFFSKRNAIVPLVMPLVFSLAASLVLARVGLMRWIIQNYLPTIVFFRGPTITAVIAIFGGTLLLNIAAIGIKARAFRDVLG